jgi:hypothetical protein
MKTTLIAATAFIALAATGAMAEPKGPKNGTSFEGSGSMSGSVMSLSAAASGSIGNGRGASEAGQFSASTSTLNFDSSYGGNSKDQNGLTITATTETFASGFDQSTSKGDNWSGAGRIGVAAGFASYEGFGETNFGAGKNKN